MAQRFAAEGAKVVINFPDDAQEDNARAVIEHIQNRGGTAKAIRADVAKESDVISLVQEAISFLGGIDILVNNAGIASTAPVEEISIDDWDRVIAVHLRGTFMMTKQVIPHLTTKATERSSTPHPS